VKARTTLPPPMYRCKNCRKAKNAHVIMRVENENTVGTKTVFLCPTAQWDGHGREETP